MNYSDESDHQDITSSEQDSHILAETRNYQLEEENKTLLKENNQLRAQFEEALHLSNNVEAVHKKNAELVTELNSVNAQKAELNKRLNLSLTSNKELTQKIEEEKKASSEALSSANIAHQKEISTIQNEFQTKYDQLLSQYQELESENKESQDQFRLVSSQLEILIRNASNYFNIKFPDFQTLSEFFESPAAITYKSQQNDLDTTKNANQTQIQMQEQLSFCNQALEKFQKRQKHAQKSIQGLKKERNQLRSQIEQLQQDSISLQQRHQQAIKSKNEEINKLKEDQLLQKQENEHIIYQLNSKIDSLSNEIKNLKQFNKSSPMKSPIQFSQNLNLNSNLHSNLSPKGETLRTPKEAKKVDIQQYLDRINNLEDANDQLAQKNLLLNGQFQRMKAKLEETQSKLENALKSQAETESDQQKVIGELQALQIVQTSLQNEVEVLRKALHSRESKKSKKLSPEQIEAREMKAKIVRLEKTVQNQNEQLYETHFELEKQIHELEKTKMLLKNAEQENKRSHEKVEEISEELEETKTSIQTKPELTINDIFPPYSWKTSEFPTELTVKIDSIASNDSLQPPSILRSIYKTISTFYNNILNEKDKEINKCNNNFMNLHSRVCSLLTDLSITLGLQPISFEEFWCQEGDQIIISKIKQISKSNNDYMNKYNQIKLIKDQFSNVIGMEFNEKSFCLMKNQILKQKEIIKHKKQQCHALKEAFLKYKQTTEKEKFDLSNELELNKENIQELINQNKLIEKEKNNQEKLIKELKEKLENQKKESQEKEENLIQQHEELINSLQNKSQLEQNQMLEKHGEKEEELNNMSNSLIETQENCSKLKKIISSQKQKIIELEEKEKQLKNDLVKVEDQEKTKAEEDKAMIIKSYNKSIAEITEQCNKHMEDLQKLAKELAINEKKEREMKKEIMKLKKEKSTIERQFKSELENEKRKISLIEASSKANQVEIETNYGIKVQELKSKYESDKRKLFSFIVDEFKDYFNPMDKFGEKSMKRILQKAKIDLEKLKYSDLAIRRLVSAQNGQKTDEAVAQIMLEN